MDSSRIPHDLQSDDAESSGLKNALQVDSADLLGADGRLLISHRGERYQLRQTRAEKLILTKLHPED